MYLFVFDIFVALKLELILFNLVVMATFIWIKITSKIINILVKKKNFKKKEHTKKSIKNKCFYLCTENTEKLKIKKKVKY